MDGSWMVLVHERYRREVPSSYGRILDFAMEVGRDGVSKRLGTRLFRRRSHLVLPMTHSAWRTPRLVHPGASCEVPRTPD